MVERRGGWRGGEERRGEASVERAAASRINITARRSALPSCPILLLLLSLPAFCFRYLPTLELLCPASPFFFFLVFFLCSIASCRTQAAKEAQKYKNNNGSPSCGSLPHSFLSTPFLNGFLPTFQHIALIHLLHDVVSLFFFFFFSIFTTLSATNLFPLSRSPSLRP